MKRSEVTVEALKKMGYVAMTHMRNDWRFGSRTNSPCTEKQSVELFELVAKAAREGGSVEIRRNNFNYTVNVFIDVSWQTLCGAPLVFYLSRPMTEVERLEADLFTGRNKKAV